jgi:uncharacterized membrane protein YkvI
LVMSLLVFSWFDSARVISPWLGVLFLFYIVANTLPLLPLFENIKRMGVMFVPNFILMVYGTTLFANIKRHDQLVNENGNPANVSEA